jgi:hypothetical protein
MALFQLDLKVQVEVVPLQQRKKNVRVILGTNSKMIRLMITINKLQIKKESFRLRLMLKKQVF